MIWLCYLHCSSEQWDVLYILHLILPDCYPTFPYQENFVMKALLECIKIRLKVIISSVQVVAHRLVQFGGILRSISFFFLAAPWHIEFPSQGSALSRSCGSIRSLTHCAGLGIKLASQHCRDTVDAIAPQWELTVPFFKELVVWHVAVLCTKVVVNI